MRNCIDHDSVVHILVPEHLISCANESQGKWIVDQECRRQQVYDNNKGMPKSAIESIYNEEQGKLSNSPECQPIHQSIHNVISHFGMPLLFHKKKNMPFWRNARVQWIGISGQAACPHTYAASAGMPLSLSSSSLTLFLLHCGLPKALLDDAGC